MKKKLTPKSIIVAALALILAVSMFGCSKDTTAAEDKTEKTVSTEKVETVQEKAEEPTAELLSSKGTEDTGTVETVDGAGLQDTEVPEDTTVEAQTPDEPEVNPNFDYAAIYADLCENHPDTASALNAAIMSIPDLLEKEDVVPLTEKYLSNTEHDPAAAPGLVDYLLEKQSSDSTTSTNTSTNTDNTNTTTSKPTTSTSQPSTNTNNNSTNISTSQPSTNTSTSQSSTNTNNNNSTNTSTSQPSTNTNNNNSTNTSTSQSSSSSSDDDWDKMLQDAIDRGVLGEGTGAEGKHNCETIDASNDYVPEWAGGEFVFGEDGTITVVGD